MGRVKNKKLLCILVACQGFIPMHVLTWLVTYLVWFSEIPLCSGCLENSPGLSHSKLWSMDFPVLQQLPVAGSLQDNHVN